MLIYYLINTDISFNRYLIDALRAENDVITLYQECFYMVLFTIYI